MSVLKRLASSTRPGLVQFYCPACDGPHMISVQPESPGGWKFNGDYDSPTLHPSVLVQSGHYAPGHRGPGCWCTYNAERPGEESVFKCVVCHSFVADGRIQYLEDCTHAMAGQTVTLPPYPPRAG